MKLVQSCKLNNIQQLERIDEIKPSLSENGTEALRCESPELSSLNNDFLMRIVEAISPSADVFLSGEIGSDPLSPALFLTSNENATQSVHRYIILLFSEKK